jgi:FkbM family methyltransferase
MKQHQGIWLPDYEKHLLEWMDKSGELVDGRGTYQIKKLRAAMEYVEAKTRAVDVGAHVGFWSMHLAREFFKVMAFEPMAEFRECFARNVEEMNVRLYGCALGAKAGGVSLVTPEGSSGGTHITGTGDIELRTLDSFDFQNVDFLKVDCEGYELAVLEGARTTLRRCRPCVIVEQKPHIMAANFGTSGHPAVDFLLKMGASVRKVMSGDYIISWD